MQSRVESGHYDLPQLFLFLPNKIIRRKLAILSNVRTTVFARFSDSVNSCVSTSKGCCETGSTLSHSWRTFFASLLFQLVESIAVDTLLSPSDTSRAHSSDTTCINWLPFRCRINPACAFLNESTCSLVTVVFPVLGSGSTHSQRLSANLKAPG